jgi:hypothetical protein
LEETLEGFISGEITGEGLGDTFLVVSSLL